MAIASMKKMSLIGLNDERKKILKALHKLGCIEITQSEELEKTESFINTDLKDNYQTKISRLNNAFALLNDVRLEAMKLNKSYTKALKSGNKDGELSTETAQALVKYAPPKKPFSLGLPAVTYDKYENIIYQEEDLLNTLEKIEDYNSKLIDIKSSTIRNISLMEQLKPFFDVDAPFNLFTQTKNVKFVLGTIPFNKEELLKEYIDIFDDCEFVMSQADKVIVVSVICHKDRYDDVMAKLLEADFTQTNFNYDKTATDKFNELETANTNLQLQKENIILNLTAYDEVLPDLEVLYDYYQIELEKVEADDKFKFTNSTFTMNAWVPTDVCESISEKLDKKFTLDISFKEPKEDEVVPTLTRNKGIVRPYEDITNMYSVPNQREIDPNPFVAFFYFLFFGMMVSDAAYGIILSIAAFVILKKAKPRKGEGGLVWVILMGGISTFIWGVIFGGWFGDGFTQIGRLINGSKTWEFWSLINPMKNPLAFLGLSLALGIVHILFGMGIHAVALIRQKKYADALCNVAGWYVVFLGLGFVAVSMVAHVSILKTIGLITAIAGLVLVFLGGGIGKKGIFGKIGGGFNNLYNITGLMSDILSYSRLFGLGLSTGVVAMVINTLVQVVITLIPIAGYVIAIPIFIGGHLFNIGINTLGAYVHDSRLQYIEFFSRFYTGAGHQFSAFGSKTKYIYIEK